MTLGLGVPHADFTTEHEAMRRRLFFILDSPSSGDFYCESLDASSATTSRYGVRLDESGQTSLEHVYLSRCPNFLDQLKTILGKVPGQLSASEEFWRSVAELTLGQILRGEVFPAFDEAGIYWGPMPPNANDTASLAILVEGIPLDTILLFEYDLNSDRLVRQQDSEIEISASGATIIDPTLLVEGFRRSLCNRWVRHISAEHVFGRSILSRHHSEDLSQVAVSRDIRGWLRLIADRIAPATQVAFRLELNSDADEEGELAPRLVVFVTSERDQSLRVDLASLPRVQEAVRRMFSAGAEEDALVSLSRAAGAFAPLRGALLKAVPGDVNLTIEELEELITSGVSELESEGFAVLLPVELIEPKIGMVGSIKRSEQLSMGGSSRMRLDGVLDVDIRPSIFDEPLTDEEVDAIADAKRSLVRFRGRWIRADRDLVSKMREFRPSFADFVTSALVGATELDGSDLTVSAVGDLIEVVERIRRASLEGESMPEPLGLCAQLRDYQKRGLAWMNALCEIGIGGCLADDMGLGKTIQVIALHLSLMGEATGPTLVVCPTSVVGNWAREFARFAPEVVVHRHLGPKRALTEAKAGEVVITSYPLIRIDQELLSSIEYDLVIADEAQYIKNHLSKTARSLRSIHSRSRIALTGTPVENHLGDLWSILDWVLPAQFGSWQRFRKSVILPIQAEKDGTVAAKFSRQIGPFVLRRRKTDPGIAPELPPKVESDLVVGLTNEQVSLYKAAVTEAISQIEASDGIERKGLILSLITALKQICNHPAQYLKELGPIPFRSAKLDATSELLEVILSEGEQCLIFTQYVSMGKMICKYLKDLGIQSSFLHGGLNAPARDELVDSFQMGEMAVLVVSLKAGGTGLNLTAASHVIHFDRWWNPATENQATDRAYRIGQTKSVQVHRLISEGTIEEKIAAMLEEKRKLSDLVLGVGEGWITELPTNEIIDLVTLADGD